MSRLGAMGRRPTGGQLLVALMVLHVLVKIALFSRTASADVVGDERFYLDGGRALSNLVRDLVALGPIDTAELQRNAVGSGWFMPGMSLVLTPLFLVDPDASMPMIRGYLGVVSSGMLLLAVAQVRRVLGVRVAAVLMVFPGLVPTWLVFSFAAWGDLTAGILVLVLVTQLVTLARGLREGSPPGLGAAARLGLVAIAVVYFRSSAMILALGLVVVLLVFAMLTLRGRARRRGVLAFAVTGAVFGSLLLPWSVAVSTALGAPVLTTTTVPTVMANTFGDREELCFGPCDPNSSIWFSPVRYARETARATGHSEVEVLQQMSDQAMTEVTPRSYARDGGIL